MARPTKSKQSGRRNHYIPEWAEHRGVSQADIVRGMEVDKGTVSRWFGGTIPSEDHLDRLAMFFQIEEPAGLFRHPHDDWMANLLSHRTDDERKRMLQTLELAFPKDLSKAS